MQGFTPAGSVAVITVKHGLRLHLESTANCSNNQGKYPFILRKVETCESFGLQSLPVDRADREQGC